jgi:large subunit ribosomal protein L1
MVKTAKRLKAASERVDPDKFHSPAEAVSLAKELATAKFDETIEVAFRLGVDPKKADQMLRGTVSLPGGSGRNVKVAVFAVGAAAREAEEAGAEFVGEDDLIERIQGGWQDFDVAIATPDLMPKVGRVGKILRGLTPNPKSGTVTTEVGKTVAEIKGGKIEYRTDKFGNVHMILGKASFAEADLLRNFAAVLDEIIRVKPSSAKGKYVKAITITSTMGLPVAVDPNVTPRDITGSRESA